jgi:hypothetical protein
MTPCRLIGTEDIKVLEKYGASVLRDQDGVNTFFQTLLTAYESTHHHNPKGKVIYL